MHDQNNIFYAIALSVVVLITWQYFFATSFLGKPSSPRNAATISQVGALASGPATIGPQAQAVATPAAATPDTQRPQPASRQQALSRSQRVAIDTPRLRGSIALRGGRIDDLSLVQYRETVDPKSKAIELLSPSGGPQAFYAEFGWVDASSVDLKVPTSNTVWRQQGSNGLGVGRPVILAWQNDQGLEFRRTISVDDNYLFTIHDEVEKSRADGRHAWLPMR